jgi:uncharacterized protein (UPF0261 family)
VASSSARLNADTNNGTKIGMRLLARWIMPPVSKSAPRAFCAFIIFSISSANVGINRRAMAIIMAISWAGTLNGLNGLSRLSMASVSWMGEVVSVRMDDPTINSISREAILPAKASPSGYILIK